MPTRKKTYKPQSTTSRRWYRMDLHLHTPASVDYREANVTYLDFLKRAEERGLDIIAFSDHNTVAGYQRYLDEVESLELLERRSRLDDNERVQLKEYRRLQEKLLILPGFELTATLGFHVLGIFPPDTSVRELEHLLLDLRVPAEKLDLGSGEVGATTDVITAYRAIDEAGGLVIAAHANSSHGVAMPGFDFGGQTRISYTQDPHLHALEVTDLTSRSRRRTALFFSGTKPEYPRRMHLIQSSDAHRLKGIPNNTQEPGVGDRPTEILLDELSFEAIKQVFLGNDFARIRPYVPSEPHAFDPISQAREEGETLVQAFHEQLSRGKGIERKILQDTVALANTNGGTIYIGVSANPRNAVVGVPRPTEAIHQLKNDIAKHIVPPLDVQLDTQKSGGKSIIRIIVPRGSDAPYALEGTQIFIRSENETGLAVRDEIVNLVRDALAVELAARPETEPAAVTVPTMAELPAESAASPELPALLPRTGVEIMPAEKRRGETQYSVRDLRNNRIIHNVTRSSARKLWQYAISEFEEHPCEPDDVKWVGDIGLCKAHKRAGKVRYDLVQRDRDGHLHMYYGVTDDGIDGPWKVLIEGEGGEPVELPESEEVEREETFENGAEREELTGDFGTGRRETTGAAEWQASAETFDRVEDVVSPDLEFPRENAHEGQLSTIPIVDDASIFAEPISESETRDDWAEPSRLAEEFGETPGSREPARPIDEHEIPMPGWERFERPEIIEPRGEAAFDPSTDAGIDLIASRRRSQPETFSERERESDFAASASMSWETQSSGYSAEREAPILSQDASSVFEVTPLENSSDDAAMLSPFRADESDESIGSEIASVIAAPEPSAQLDQPDFESQGDSGIAANDIRADNVRTVDAIYAVDELESEANRTAPESSEEPLDLAASEALSDTEDDSPDASASSEMKSDSDKAGR